MKEQLSPLSSVIECALKFAIFAAAFAGVYLQAVIDGGFFKPKIYLYFTIISNTGIALLILVMLPVRIAEILSKRQIMPRWLYTLKYLFTSALFTTMVVAFAVLAPAIRSIDYILTPKNLLAHLLAPLFATLDFLLFDKGYVVKKYSVLQSLILPGVFSLVTLLLSVKRVYYTNGTNYPYFFFDYRSLGWFTLSLHRPGTFWWLLMVSGITMLSAWILLKMKRLCGRWRNAFIVYR